MHPLLLARHGETEWSRSGRHTSRTDVGLTPEGEAQARSLGAALTGWAPVRVLTSPLVRARRTAALAGFGSATVEPRLTEWDYGSYEGLTSAEIERERPGWALWDDGAPGGESPGDVGRRLDDLLEDLRPRLGGGPVLCFAHGHILRALAARWLGQPVADGRLYALDTAGWCALDTEHEREVIRAWNIATGGHR